MNKEYAPIMDSRKYLTELRRLIDLYNKTAYNILQNEIKPLLPQISRQKCGIITTLVSSFIGLAYEGISSFLQ